MSLLGNTTLAMWWNIAEQEQREFEHWHSTEHLAERLSIPGFIRGTRWRAASGEGSYFVLYELASIAVLDSPQYLERVNDPTPWSAKVMAGFRNMVRSRCRVTGSLGGGLGQSLATVRFSPQPGASGGLRTWLVEDLLQSIPTRPGLTGAHLIENLAPKGQVMTAEQRLRGGDAMADWAILAGGYNMPAVTTLAENQLREEMLMRRGALPGIQADLFTLQFSARGDDFEVSR